MRSPSLSSDQVSILSEIRSNLQRLQATARPREVLRLALVIDDLANRLRPSALVSPTDTVSAVLAPRRVQQPPGHAGDVHNRTVVLRKLNRRDEALECLRSALQAKEGTSTDFHNCAIEAENLHDESLRLALCERGLQIAPQQRWLLLNYADCLSKLGRQEEAEEAFAKSLAQNPDSARVLSGYVEHLVGHGRNAEARAQVARLQEVSKSVDDFRYQVVAIRAAKGTAYSNDEYASLMRQAAADILKLRVMDNEGSKQKGARLASIASGLADIGDKVGAAQAYFDAVRLGFEDSTALSNLAADLRNLWNLATLSIRVRRIALLIQPDDQVGWRNLFATLGNSGAIAIQALSTLMDTDDYGKRMQILDQELGPLTREDVMRVLSEVASFLEGDHASLGTHGAAADDSETFEEKEHPISDFAAWRSSRAAGQ